MNNVLDILKKQTLERLDPVTGRQPLSGTNVTLAPSLSEQSPDPELGRVTDAKFGWRQSLIDQSVPSEDFFTTEILLAQILDSLRKEQQLAVVGDYVRTINIPVGAQTATAFQLTKQIYDIGQFGHIYIPNDIASPITTYRLFKGMSTDDLLFTGTNANPFSMKIPGVDVITIQFNTDVLTPDNFQIYLSVRPILVFR